MLMRIVTMLAIVLLASATALLGLFYLGTEEQHAELLAQHFWGTLGLRFVFVGAVGLVGAALWWGVNWALLKSGLVPNINLRKTALLAIAGVMSGSLVGALIFCLS
jgi:hypothetical protein